MTVMLIIVIIALYMDTIGGPAGAKQAIYERAAHVNDSIERMSP